MTLLIGLSPDGVCADIYTMSLRGTNLRRVIFRLRPVRAGNGKRRFQLAAGAVRLAGGPPAA